MPLALWARALGRRQGARGSFVLGRSLLESTLLPAFCCRPKLGVRKPKLVMTPKSASPKPAKPMSEPRSHSGPRGVLGPKGAEAGYLRIAPKR